MKYKCCDYLLHEIVFAQNAIIPCCCSPSHEYNIQFYSNYCGSEFSIGKYSKQKQNIIEQFKHGIIPKGCENCIMIKEKEWDESLNINRIIITNRTKCSCNCIYCSLITTSNQTKKELNTRTTYDIKPVLYNLSINNLINENCLITIAGGECSEYPKGELEYIIFTALFLNCRLEILSSGITYSKAIENALKLGKCFLKVSVDSGTKKTYEKIKRVKKYNDVWRNLRNYIMALDWNSQSDVIIKYIIIPGINDNLDEASAFIKKCKSIKCKTIELTVEYIWYGKNKHLPINRQIYDVVQYIKSSGLNVIYEHQSENWLKNGGNNAI